MVVFKPWWRSDICCWIWQWYRHEVIVVCQRCVVWLSSIVVFSKHRRTRRWSRWLVWMKVTAKPLGRRSRWCRQRRTRSFVVRAPAPFNPMKQRPPWWISWLDSWGQCTRDVLIWMSPSSLQHSQYSLDNRSPFFALAGMLFLVHFLHFLTVRWRLNGFLNSGL